MLLSVIHAAQEHEYGIPFPEFPGTIQSPMRCRPSTLFQWILLLCLWILPSSALAAPILLVKPSDLDSFILETFNRLRGELHMHGFQVAFVESPSKDPPTPSQLAGLAEAHGALAGVAISRIGGKTNAEIWIADRVTGKTSIRTIITTNEKDAPALLAIRTVDLLRNSLREFEVDTPPSPEIKGANPTLASPDVVAAFTQAKQTHSSISLSAGVFMLFDHRLGAGFGPGLSLSYWFLPRFSLSMEFVGILLGQSYSTNQATARMREELVALSLSISIWRGKTIDQDLFFGAGAMRFTVHGEAVFPWIGKDTTAWAGFGQLGTKLHYQLRNRVRIELTAAAVLQVPHPVIEVADEHYTLDNPAFLGSLGLKLDF